MLFFSLALAAPAALLGPASPAAAYSSSTVLISGHGYGHGIGMGQWGSLGYAIGQDNGLGPQTYQWILSHYYGNDGNGGAGASSLQTVPDTSLHGGNVLVAMTEADGIDTIVSATSGDVNYPGGSAPAVLFHQVAANSFDVETGPGCAGPWSAPVGPPSADPIASPPATGFLNLCTPTATVELHGTLEALTNSAGSSRTVNTWGSSNTSPTWPQRSPHLRGPRLGVPDPKELIGVSSRPRRRWSQRAPTWRRLLGLRRLRRYV